MKTAELCRQNSINEASYYNWKAKYAALAGSDVQKLKGSGAWPDASVVA